LVTPGSFVPSLFLLSDDRKLHNTTLKIAVKIIGSILFLITFKYICVGHIKSMLRIIYMSDLKLW